MVNKRIPHTNEELIALFKKDNIDKQYFEKFIAYYKVSFDELNEDYKDYTDEDFDEGDTVQDGALRSTYRYVKPFLHLLERGHSEDWAHEIAYSVNDDLELDVHYAYSKLKIDNPDLARKDLLIQTKSLGGDKYFDEYYLHLFDVDSEPRERIQTAKNYSNEVKKQLAKGKSALYANEYANLRMDYHEIYCEDYAFAYEKSIYEKRSEEYARIFADKYASVLVDIKKRHGISDDEEMMAFAIEKVNAYMCIFRRN